MGNLYTYTGKVMLFRGYEEPWQVTRDNKIYPVKKIEICFKKQTILEEEKELSGECMTSLTEK